MPKRKFIPSLATQPEEILEQVFAFLSADELVKQMGVNVRIRRIAAKAIFMRDDDKARRIQASLVKAWATQRQLPSFLAFEKAWWYERLTSQLSLPKSDIEYQQCLLSVLKRAFNPSYSKALKRYFRPNVDRDLEWLSYVNTRIESLVSLYYLAAGFQNSSTEGLLTRTTLALLKMVASGSSPIIDKAAPALSMLRFRLEGKLLTRVTNTLLKLLRDENRGTRTAAATLLGDFGNQFDSQLLPKVINELLRCATDKDYTTSGREELTTLNWLLLKLEGEALSKYYKLFYKAIKARGNRTARKYGRFDINEGMLCLTSKLSQEQVKQVVFLLIEKLSSGMLDKPSGKKTYHFTHDDWSLLKALCSKLQGNDLADFINQLLDILKGSRHIFPEFIGEYLGLVQTPRFSGYDLITLLSEQLQGDLFEKVTHFLLTKLQYGSRFEQRGSFNALNKIIGRLEGELLLKVIDTLFACYRKADADKQVMIVDLISGVITRLEGDRYTKTINILCEQMRIGSSEQAQLRAAIALSHASERLGATLLTETLSVLGEKIQGHFAYDLCNQASEGIGRLLLHLDDEKFLEALYKDARYEDNYLAVILRELSGKRLNSVVSMCLQQLYIDESHINIRSRSILSKVVHKLEAKRLINEVLERISDEYMSLLICEPGMFEFFSSLQKMTDKFNKLIDGVLDAWLEDPIFDDIGTHYRLIFKCCDDFSDKQLDKILGFLLPALSTGGSSHRELIYQILTKIAYRLSNAQLFKVVERISRRNVYEQVDIEQLFIFMTSLFPILSQRQYKHSIWGLEINYGPMIGPFSYLYAEYSKIHDVIKRPDLANKGLRDKPTFFSKANGMSVSDKHLDDEAMASFYGQLGLNYK